MTADEAKQALKEGKKVACRDWKRYEYVKQEIRTVVVDERGTILSDTVFENQKDVEWEIVE